VRLLVRATSAVVVVAVATASGATAGDGQRFRAQRVAPQGAAAELAVGTGGDVVAIWGNGTNVVESAFRARGSRWSPPVTVARGTWRKLGIDGRGNATLLWSSTNPGTDGTKVLVAERPRGAGAWSAPCELSGWQRAIAEPGLDVNVAGDAIASFWDGELKAAFRPRSGTWQEAMPIGFGTGGINADVALDDAGNAFAVWEAPPFAANRSIYAAQRSVASGSWTAPVRIASGQPSGEPRLAVNGRGDAVVVWVAGSSSAWQSYRAFVASWSRDLGAWSSAETLGDRPYSEARIALDESGNATVLGVPPPHLATARLDMFERATTDGRWSGPATRELTRHPTALSLVAGEGDQAAVSWVSDDVLFVVRKDGANHWSAPTPLAPAWSTDLAFTPSGDVVFAYTFSGRASESLRGVFVGALDVTQPRIARVVVPTRARTGQRVRFSIAASDEWSGLDRPTWRFGDGTRADGSRAWHVYRRPGRYAVVVTVRDSAGNAVSRRSTIRVG
jgi:PKD domain